MATAKWAAPSAPVTLTLPGDVASLGNGLTSTFITYDNSINRDLYGNVRLTLGSLTPTTGASVTLRVFATQNGAAPDSTGSVGGGDTYTQALTLGAGIKEVNFPMVRLYPESLRFALTNNANVALAASGNAMYLRPYNEDVS
jgi:hypothetical protein